MPAHSIVTSDFLVILSVLQADPLNTVDLQQWRQALEGNGPLFGAGADRSSTPYDADFPSASQLRQSAPPLRRQRSIRREIAPGQGKISGRCPVHAGKDADQQYVVGAIEQAPCGRIFDREG